MKTIAVLLTVFNRKKTTLACLERLFKHKISNDISVDIWLTNDGCTDGTPEAVKQYFPEVNIVDGDGSLFWNRGMWTAWNAASAVKTYDYYLWLNDDTLLLDDALDILIEASVEKSDKAIIVGVCKSSINNETTYSGYVNKRRISPNGCLQNVDYFNGNIVLVPSFVFNIVGNLDFYYRHSHGDTDYGQRAKSFGINSFISKGYIGICDRHVCLSKWCNPSIPIRERFISLYLPTGYHPKEVFHYEYRHNGIVPAIFHIITLYLRVLFPSFWISLRHHSKP